MKYMFTYNSVSTYLIEVKTHLIVYVSFKLEVVQDFFLLSLKKSDKNPSDFWGRDMNRYDD